jgi:uncharacterized protein YjcR
MAGEMEKKNGKRKRGGQEGNQNARKHGFYSKVLDEKELADYEDAIALKGFDEEIALMRVKLISLVERDPENVRLISQAVNSLVKLMIAKYTEGKDKELGTKDAIRTVLRDVALPVGIKIVTSLGL